MYFFKLIWSKVLKLLGKTRWKLSNVGPLGILWTYKTSILRGKQVYIRLTRKYGERSRIYVEHYPGTGDIYITCALLKKYHIIHHPDEDYIVTLIGNNSKKIATLLRIELVEVLTQQESDDMIRYLSFMGSNISNVTILHYAPSALYTRVLDELACYNGLDFMTMYMNTVFKGMDWQRDSVPFYKQEGAIEVAQEYLDLRNLRSGHTVVLFPYANTVEHLPINLWEELARHLREVGFSVCTNVQPGGEPIPGTAPIFVPYNVLTAFVELAGIVIGLRSGIFDILAEAECEKYILYPTPNHFKFGVGTIMDYFSLANMGIGVKIHEYEFERIYTKEGLKTVFFDICDHAGITIRRQYYERSGDYPCPELFVNNHLKGSTL